MLKNKLSFTFNKPEVAKLRLKTVERSFNVAFLGAKFEYAYEASTFYKYLNRFNTDRLK